MQLPEPVRRLRQALCRAQIPVYAGNAAFFLILSFLPLLTLALAVLQYTVFRPEDLLALFSRVVPQEVLPLFRDLLQIGTLTLHSLPLFLILAAASLVLYSLVAWAIGWAAAVVRAWKAGRQRNAPNSRRRGHGA